MNNKIDELIQEEIDLMNELSNDIENNDKFSIENLLNQLTKDEKTALNALDKVSKMEDFTYDGILKRYEQE